MIDPDIRDIIAPELAEGEELLWAGRPNPKYWYRDLLYALFMTGFVKVLFGKYIYVTLMLFFEILSSGDIVAMFIAGFVALAFGAFPLVMLGLGWRHALKSRFEYYAATDRRVIIVENIWPKVRFDIPLERIKSINDHQWVHTKTIKIISVLDKHPRFFQRLLCFNQQPAPRTKYALKNYQYLLRRVSDTKQVSSIIDQSMT